MATSKNFNMSSWMRQSITPLFDGNYTNSLRPTGGGGGGAPETANVYVAVTGNDTTGDGTIGNPYLTIAKGLSMLSAGQLMYARGGVYTESTVSASTKGIHIPLSGTLGNVVRIEGYPGESVVIDQGGSTGEAANGLCAFNKSYITIKNFEIRNCYETTAEDNIGGIFLDNCNNITIEDCYIHSIDGQAGGNVGGIRTDFSYDCTIRNNKIHTIRVGGTLNGNGAGLHGYGQYNITAEQNTIYDAYCAVYHKSSAGKTTGNFGYDLVRNLFHTCEKGFYDDVAGGGSPPQNKQIIRQNIMYAIAQSCIERDASDPAVDNGVSEIYHNTLENLGSEAAIWINDSDGYTGYNNIIHGATGDSLRFQGPHTITQSDYNCYFNNNSFIRYLYNIGGTQETYSTLAAWQGQGFDLNSVQSDPLFVNAASRDYHLQGGSPLLTAGQGAVAMGAYITGSEQIGCDF